MKLRGITIKLLIIVTFMVLIFLSNTVYATTNEIEDRSDTEVVSYNLETQVEVVETYDNSITMHRAGYNSIIPNYEPKTKQRVIVGNDDRNGMMSINKYPYSATCLIISYYSDGTSYMGSGAIISQDKVLTSGHNLYDYDKKLWVTSVDVIPTAFGGTEFSNILTKEVFIMATSSITKNFVISGQKQVEMFADAIEASANDRTPLVPINVTYLQGADEIVKFMEKRKKADPAGK